MFTAGEDADALERSVRRRRISQIWHMTRINHLRSILTNRGLLSRARMDERGIPYQMSGWGSTGKADDMKDYICCSLVPPWGMSPKPEEYQGKSVIQGAEKTAPGAIWD